MSNFNIALLRTLHESLNNSLTKVSDQLTDLLDSKINVGSFTGAEDVNLVANGLLMIKAWGEHNFALNLHSLLKAIKDDKISDDNLYYQAIKVSRNATKSLSAHLTTLAKKDPKSANLVSLWPVWSEMNKFLGKKDTSVNNLFIPYANFNDVKFEKVEERDLYSTVEDIKEDFDKESNKWLAAQDKESAITPLKRMIDLVDTLYQLRHTVGYQSYWLALKGRLVLALNDPNMEVDNKVNLAESLSKASFEMRSFAQGKKIIDIEILQQLILPLLDERAQILALKNNTMSEVYQRFDINRFLNDAKNVLSIENQEKIELFNQNITMIKEALHNIRESWIKHINTSADKKDLLAAIRNLLMKKDIFPQNGATVALLTSLYSVFNKYKLDNTKDKVNEVIAKEFATLLIMLDKYIEKKCIVSEDFQKQVELQAKRVELALLDKKEELDNLPLPSWDDDTKKNEHNAAQLIAITEVKKDFQEIERILDDVLRGNEDGLVNIAKVDAPIRMSIGALTLMKEGAAVNVLGAIRKMCTNVSINQSITDEEIEAITVSMSGLGLFFDALEKGDSNAVMMLAPAVKMLFGKELSAPKEIPNFNFDVGGEDEIVTITPETIVVPEKEEVITKEESVVNIEPELTTPPEVIEEIVEEPTTPEIVENVNLNIFDQQLIEEKVEDVVEDVIPTPIIEEKEETLDTEEKVSVNIDSLFKKEEVKEKEIEATPFSLDDLISQPSSVDENKDQEVYNEVHSEIEAQKIESEVEETEEEKAVKPQLIIYDKEDPDCYYGDYLEEILEDIAPSFDSYLEEIHEDATNMEAFRGIRRTFHTLKGSGKQVSLWPMAYVGQHIEYRFNDILAANKPWTPELEKLATRSVAIYTDWANELLNNGRLDFDPSEIFQLLDEEELTRELDSMSEDEDEEDNDFDNQDLHIDNFGFGKTEDNKPSLVAEKTDLSEISSIVKDNDSVENEDKDKELPAELKEEPEIITQENIPQFEEEPEQILHEEMDKDERNIEGATDVLGVDNIDPIESEKNMDTTDYLPVFDNEEIEEEEVEEDNKQDVNELFIRIDTVIDNIRDDYYTIEDSKKVPLSLFENLDMIKDIAIEVNYLSLESTIDKYVAKLDEIDEDELSWEDISNISAVKDVIIDALIKIVDNGFLADIDSDELIGKIRPEESVETIETEDVVVEPEVILEKDNDKPISSENTQVVEDKENIESDIDKDKQLDIILTTLLNMKDNIDILKEAFSKLYK